METDPKTTGFFPVKQYHVVGPGKKAEPRYATRSLSDLDLADELERQLDKFKAGEHDEGWLEALRVERRRRVGVDG